MSDAVMAACDDFGVDYNKPVIIGQANFASKRRLVGGGVFDRGKMGMVYCALR